MATSSSIVYVNHRDLKDVFPALDSFDTKVEIYGWKGSGTANQYQAENCGLVTQLFADGADLGSAESSQGDVDSNGKWYYDSANDVVYYFNNATSPEDMVMESGEDSSTLITRQIKSASRMVESSLDSRLAREISKDREGNYPEYIKRATSLKTIVMLLQSKDPENPVIESFNEEYNDIIDGFRSGNIQLPHATTADSSKGIIREVNIDNATDLRLIETLGNYTTHGFDLVKVKVITGGVIGTATYSVWVKDQDKLKNHKVVDEELITGDFDICAAGLYIRFAGDDDSAVCTANDEYEIECKSSSLPSSVSHSGSITLTRR